MSDNSDLFHKPEPKKQPPVKYERLNHEPIRECTACGVSIWFKKVEKIGGGTSHIPVELSSGENHFIHCTKADKFRKRGKA